MEDIPDVFFFFTKVRIMEPATQAKSPASGRVSDVCQSSLIWGPTVPLLQSCLHTQPIQQRTCRRERAELKLGLSKDSQLIPLSRRTPRDTTVGKNVENRLDTEDLEQRELFNDSRGISHRKRRWLSLSENESASPVMGSDGT